MSVMARRLSACLPQEALARRASSTSQDLASHMCHLDSTNISPHDEGKDSSLYRETSTRPEVKTPKQESRIFLALNAARRLSSSSGGDQQQQQQQQQCPDHLAGRRRSFDVTWISAQAFPADRRRSSLRYGSPGDPSRV